MLRASDLARPWTDEVFRATAPEWATAEHLLSGLGGIMAAGRWNAMGAFRVIYASLTPEGALAEALARARHRGIADSHAMPLVVSALRVRLAVVLDLRTEEAANALAVSPGALAREDWRVATAGGRESLSQAVGRAAHAAHLEGMIVPGVAAANLLILPDHAARPGSLHVVRRGQGRAGP
jgi:RES domain-containing protein